MKVLHTLRNLSRSDGGQVTSTYQLAKGLRSCGVDTQILAISSRDTSADLPADKDVIRYVDHDVITPYYYSRNFSRYVKDHVGEYDLVHINSLWQWPSHCAAVEARRRGIPTVIAPRGVLIPQALKKSRWKKITALALFQRKDLQKANLIHATSQIELEGIRLLGLKNPVAVIPNCVSIPDESLLRKAPNSTRTFIYAGRLDSHKNIDMLLRAWGALGAKTADCELLIVGDGPKTYQSMLRRLAYRLRLSNVKFVPMQSSRALMSMMSEADFLVLPSKSENFGMVVAEALAIGVPVVATQNSPWKILDAERCGISHEPQLDQLVEALRRAISLPEGERREMGLRGRAFVSEHYVPEKVASDMKTAYQWVLSGNELPKFIDI